MGRDFPGGSDGKESACQCKRPRSNPWVRKIPCRREWQPTPVFLPGEFHGQRSPAGYSPCGHKEWDTTEQPPWRQSQRQRFEGKNIYVDVSPNTDSPLKIFLNIWLHIKRSNKKESACIFSSPLSDLTSKQIQNVLVFHCTLGNPWLFLF